MFLAKLSVSSSLSAASGGIQMLSLRRDETLARLLLLPPLVLSAPSESSPDLIEHSSIDDADGWQLIPSRVEVLDEKSPSVRRLLLYLVLSPTSAGTNFDEASLQTEAKINKY
jgi:hypothetical protein